MTWLCARRAGKRAGLVRREARSLPGRRRDADAPIEGGPGAPRPGPRAEARAASQPYRLLGSQPSHLW